MDYFLSTTPLYRIHLDYLIFRAEANGIFYSYLQTNNNSKYILQKYTRLDQTYYILDGSIQFHIKKDTYREYIYFKILNQTFYDPEDPFNSAPTKLSNSIQTLLDFTEYIQLNNIRLLDFHTAVDFSNTLKIDLQKPADVYTTKTKVIFFRGEKQTKSKKKNTDTTPDTDWTIYFNTGEKKTQSLSVIFYEKSKLLKDPKFLEKSNYQNPDGYLDTRMELRLRRKGKSSRARDTMDLLEFYLLEKPNFFIKHFFLLSIYLFYYYKDIYSTEGSILNPDDLFIQHRISDMEKHPQIKDLLDYIKTKHKSFTEGKSIYTKNKREELIKKPSNIYKRFLQEWQDIYRNPKLYTPDPDDFILHQKANIKKGFLELDLDLEKHIHQRIPLSTPQTQGFLSALDYYIQSTFNTDPDPYSIPEQDIYSMDLSPPPF